MSGLSATRIFAILSKEFTQLRRDRLTYSMILAMPVIQLLLFGYAINSNPHNLPTAVLVQDHGPFARSVVAAIKNTGYFNIVAAARSQRQLDRLMGLGEVDFTIAIPADFTRKVVRRDGAQILVEADASDPTATTGALAALANLPNEALAHDLQGAATPAPAAAPFEIVAHSRYNPEGITAYNIVPGLLGTLLSMTLVMMTSLSLTRERERGTMESLLATPVKPIEVMIGKLAPYVGVGLIQSVVILIVARSLFGVPMQGGWSALAIGLILFIVGSLLLGFLISTICQTQRQAQQLAQFYMMPSILLSGFMFPFDGMPGWAQVLGSAVPVTHFLRVVRGSLLKGHGLSDAWPSLAALAIFVLVVGALSMARYRTTLD